MVDSKTCPFCELPLKQAYLYVRGIGAALHTSAQPGVGLLSRANLQQIDLGKISQTDTGAQAVIPALQCEACDSISFQAAR